MQRSHHGYSICRHFLDVLVEREAEAGRRFCTSTVLRGAIECDATSIGRFHVNKDNEEYAGLIWSLQQKTGVVPPAYPAHVKVIGLRQRDGHIIIHVLRPHVP